MWRFWRWPRPPMDEFTAMALLVRAIEEKDAGWRVIRIERDPNGGVKYGWQ
jgi:hypothetical protein